MCTIALAYRVRSDAPVFVAANRDEYYDRPAAPPMWRTDGPIPVLAPTDCLRGGTWIGVNATGVFAGLTNRRTPGDARSPITRGRIVLDALAHPTATLAAAALTRAVDPAQYRPFHCIIADQTAAFLCWNDGAHWHERALVPGFYVITQWSLGAHDRDRSVRTCFSLDVRTASHDAFVRALAQHASPGAHPLDGTCVHRTDIGYGTRSSSIIAVTHTGSVAYTHAEGAPCAAPFAYIPAHSEHRVEAR